ncbi:MAG: mercury methylation corrinoid protein HgcA [candidate division KSB1 bacterium]|nr:mercury methylation corrinoid protein HgcA [candidate division KSB1 bacterium]MDZ7385846.1 mercury methylation corrinoid protein HgcA [candidate division KSB1 bacterium]MDZ7391728.1 mercury methylation corrinoid protein HgcA [candidate division KSB1 bacterium]
MKREHSEQTSIHTTTSTISWANRLDHVVARLGVRRRAHRVEPGLYALGSPTAQSPVLVTANYTLSFDALRSALRGRDAYILVLDTEGINVWCAAGKGTFGTEELVRRILATNLARVVSHRRVIVPQLGASGVAAHLVAEVAGFTVEFGPVRAADLPTYLDTGRATPEMRRVRFALRDRLVLIPVEFVHSLVPMIVAAVILWFAGGWLPALAAPIAVVAGTVLFPTLLPWLPTPNFSTKGFVLGLLAWLPLALALVLAKSGVSSPAGRWAWVGITALGVPAVVAFLGLNFTGATPVTSRSGVEREILRYVPLMAGMGVISLVGIVTMAILRVA